MAEKEIGKVFSYFSNIGVAAINMTGKLKKGDKVRIKGHTTDFEQIAESMQIKGKEIKETKKGDEVGMKVKDKVRPNDAIFLVA
jgi:translation elongation factor EF-1alpha